MLLGCKTAPKPPILVTVLFKKFTFLIVLPERPRMKNAEYTEAKLLLVILKSL